MYKKNGFKLSLITIALLSSFNVHAANTIDDSSNTSTVNNSDNIFITGPNNDVNNSLNTSVQGPNNNINYLDNGSVSGHNNTFDGSSLLGGMQKTTIDGNSNYVASDNSNVRGSFNDVRGSDNTALSIDSVLNGNNLISVGKGNTLNGDNSTAIGNNSTVNAVNSVALGDNLNVNRDNVVDVGGKQVANVGDAIQQTDAVNLRQLQQGLASVGGGAYDDLWIKEDLATTNRRIDRLDRQIDKVERKLSQGIAGVAAMGSAPLIEGKTTVTVNGATYNGEVAVGGSFTSSIRSDFAITGGIAIAGSSPVAKIGVMFAF